MKFNKKKVLVYGMSQSGIWASRLLQKKHAKVYIYDDNHEVLRFKSFKNCYLVERLDEDMIAKFDYIIVSPSITLDNIYLAMAIDHKVPVISELELGASFAKDVVAITGTNGKTTTTELVTKLLSKRHKAVACGNIGYPISRAVLEGKGRVMVAEVSSFMLEHAMTFSPNVATVLNIQPDHLVRHKTMEEYARLKLGIFKNLQPHNYAIVNLDDNITPTVDARTITYSYKRNADVYLKGGYIYLHNHRLVAVNELNLKGKHNILNIMCAICFAYIYKVKPEDIRKVLLTFTSDHYRSELVCEVDGIQFINDSKSTNIASTLACVESIRNPIILLLGGSNKRLDYTELFAHLPKRVRRVIAFGDIREDLRVANADRFNLEVADDLKSAFSLATAGLKRNDTVILSPASASYDQFASYIERGKYFNELVRAYEKEQK